MENRLLVRKVSAGPELDAVFEIRRKVFVDEQNCPPELEWEFEDQSTHFLGTVNGHPAGACRWRRTSNGVKLERFAVGKEFRGKGLAQAMVSVVLKDIPLEEHYLYLHAQIDAIGLYKKFGFVEEGEEFVEAGIRHYKMVLNRL